MKVYFISVLLAIVALESYSFYSLRKMETPSDDRFPWSAQWCGYDSEDGTDRDCRTIAKFPNDSICEKLIVTLQDEWKPRLKCERR